jgi:predicted RNA-binding protein with EMAP domain
MVTRKGIIITAIILGGISAASFIVWVLPQNRSSTFIVSDYGNELDSIRERHGLIATQMESNLQNLLNQTLSPYDFTNMTQTSSIQVTSLITELIESNPPAQWRESYLNYNEALKKYNEYLTETVSLANKMKNGISSNDLNDEISKLDSLKNESNSFIVKSNETRP